MMIICICMLFVVLFVCGLVFFVVVDWLIDGEISVLYFLLMKNV